MSINRILSGLVSLDVEESQELRQFASDYGWSGPLADQEYAAETVIADLTSDLEHVSEEAVGILRSALIDSAERYISLLETGIVGVCRYCGHPICADGVRIDQSRDVDTSGAGRPRCSPRRPESCATNRFGSVVATQPR